MDQIWPRSNKTCPNFYYSKSIHTISSKIYDQICKYVLKFVQLPHRVKQKNSQTRINDQYVTCGKKRKKRENASYEPYKLASLV